jgi:hypothetical protein
MKLCQSCGRVVIEDDRYYANFGVCNDCAVKEAREAHSIQQWEHSVFISFEALTAEQITAKCNEMGNEGWQLAAMNIIPTAIGYCSNNPREIHLAFKREKQ